VAETFGEALRGSRLAASLTQEELAERAGVSATAIAALERGRRRAPRLSTLRRIGEALGLDAVDLADLARLASGPDRDRPGHADGTARKGTNPLAADGSIASLDRPDLPAVMMRRWQTEFVGRDEELHALADAFDGRKRLVVVSGEAGIGKTRLVTRFADGRASEGVRFAWGRCSEEGLGAYAPFVEVIRQLVSSLDRSRLVRAIGGRGELTRLVPELDSLLGPLPAPTRAESGTEQRLLFESVASLFAAAAPLLVVIDDLHWADDASIALLAYLVRDVTIGDVMLLGTTREPDTTPELAGRLADLGRMADTTRLRLGPLLRGDLAVLVADIVGSSVGPDIVDSVAGATDGNPFYAEEMTLHLVDAGLIVEGAGGSVLRGDSRSAGVPDRVRESLARRLLALPSDALDLLTAGSLIGREFNLALAGRVSDLEGPRLLDAADSALLSGLVDESEAGHLAFSHALVQHAVGERLSVARAAAVHRRVAEKLEEGDPPPDDAVLVAELARHWAAVAAFDVDAAAIAARWAVRAGDAALAAAAADEAIARYEDASVLWSSASAGHADALIRLGIALQYRGRADEADERFREGLLLADVQHDVVLRARAAIGLGRRYPYWESDSDRIEILERALGALVAEDDEEELLRLSIMGLLVTQMISGFRDEEAHRRDELADRLAAVASDPATNEEAFASLGHIRLYDCIEDPALLAEVASRLVEVGERRNDLRVLSVAHFSRALSALDRAAMTELRAATQRYVDVADQLDDPRERSQAATACATLAYIEGDYSRSEQLTAEALERGHESGDYNADLVFSAQSLLRAVDLGQAAEALEVLEAATEYQQIASITAGTALCAAVAGERDVATTYVDRMMQNGLTGYPRGADRLAPIAFLAHACSLIANEEHAESLYQALVSQPALGVRVGPLLGWWGPVDHHAGSLARLLGRTERAESHLRRALDVEEQMGARPFLARTRAELAQVLDSSGRRVEADALRAMAAEEVSSLGAVGIGREIGASAP
jgi:transcriptional regulator with XRE-family HTH domain/tetratricopeptide (TPR) repeat protein